MKPLMPIAMQEELKRLLEETILEEKTLSVLDDDYEFGAIDTKIAFIKYLLEEWGD